MPEFLSPTPSIIGNDETFNVGAALSNAIGNGLVPLKPKRGRPKKSIELESSHETPAVQTSPNESAKVETLPPPPKPCTLSSKNGRPRTVTTTTDPDECLKTRGKQRAEWSPRSSEGKLFDCINIVSSPESDPSIKRKPGRPRKLPDVSCPVPVPSVPYDGRQTCVSPSATSVRKMGTKERHISLSSGSFSSSDGADNATAKRKPGRPRKSISTAMPRTIYPLSSIIRGKVQDIDMSPSNSVRDGLAPLKPKEGLPRKSTSPKAPSIHTLQKKSATVNVSLLPSNKRKA
ncbi:hypothetical protein CPB84DRAFT_1845325 [Gymnopilus junonius]|uniref:Uncharacterized protein n=1 Tax=Gymnopilus junonius TaxID=109634 RepID=A0A9P5NSY2_GYMJU|nr:hypothetical protein CPB84DRAFT_1845325 [Gymnopilus junonius]